MIEHIKMQRKHDYKNDQAAARFVGMFEERKMWCC